MFWFITPTICESLEKVALSYKSVNIHHTSSLTHDEESTPTKYIPQFPPKNEWLSINSILSYQSKRNTRITSKKVPNNKENISMQSFPFLKCRTMGDEWMNERTDGQFSVFIVVGKLGLRFPTSIILYKSKRQTSLLIWSSVCMNNFLNLFPES